MQGMRILHVKESWEANESAARYITGIVEGLIPYGGESHLICGEISGPLPNAFEKHRVVAELCNGKQGFRDLLDTLHVLKPHVVWLHNIGSHTLIQRLNRPERNYALWQHIHDHTLTCLTGRRLCLLPGRREARHGRSPWGHNAELLLCREPLSIRCFSETDAGRCSGEKENGEAGYIFTDYITRLNLLLAMQKTDCVTVQNEYMKEVISINIPHFEKGIHVIPGVPGTAVFGSMDRAAARSPKVHTRKHVLYRGPIERLTGLHRVIEALSSVHADCPVSLTISGISVDGHYLPECQETASRSMKKNKFLSITFNDREDGVDYSGYDVVLLTSNRGEVSSMETARAAMQGAAVIALHPPETGMSIAGISCKSDVNSIAETVWTLLVDEDLRISMVKETSGLLMEYFSPDRQGRMIQDLVREHSPVFRQQEHSLLDG